MFKLFGNNARSETPSAEEVLAAMTPIAAGLPPEDAARPGRSVACRAGELSDDGAFLMHQVTMRYDFGDRKWLEQVRGPVYKTSDLVVTHWLDFDEALRDAFATRT